MKDRSEPPPTSAEAEAFCEVTAELEGGLNRGHEKWRPPYLLGDEERIKAWFPSLVAQFVDAHAAICRARILVKSPIEEIFLATLWASDELTGVRAVINGEDAMVAAALHFTGDPTEGVWLKIQPQAPVGKYVADFILSIAPMYESNKTFSRIAVELDGHDFHEKTKAQAAHDKKRDRFFAAEEIPLLRFTGSEINRDPKACVAEAVALLRRRVTKK